MKDNILNPNQAIKDSLPLITEAFVEFYGEEARDQISTAFSNVKIIGYNSLKANESHLRTIKKGISTNLQMQFLKEAGLDTGEEIFSIFFKNADMEYLNISPIMQFYNLYGKQLKSYQEGDYNEFIEKANQIFGTSTVETTEKLLELKPILDKCVDEYAKTMTKYQEFEKYIKACNTLESNLNQKYLAIFLSEYSSLLSEKDKSYIEKCKVNKTKIEVYKLECFQILVNYDYSYDCSIDAFSGEASDKLVDDRIRDYVKNNIKNDRIIFFKKHGIDLGDNYEDYMKNEQCQRLIPSQELLTAIANSRKKLHEEEEKAFITSTQDYQKTWAEIEELQLLDSTNEYNYKNLRDGGTFVAPNLRMIDGQFVFYPLLLLNVGDTFEYLDHHLVHELNHLYECGIVSLSEEDQTYSAKTGWDIINGNIRNSTQIEESEGNREFEQFNEIINELIAQEISTIMHSRNIYIFNDASNAKIRYGTSYENVRAFVEPLYNMYKKDIIASRSIGGIEALFQVVPKDIIMRLNKIVTEFQEYFVGFKLYNMLEARGRNEVNDDVIKYARIIDDVKKIYQDLKKLKELDSESKKIV